MRLPLTPPWRVDGSPTAKRAVLHDSSEVGAGGSAPSDWWCLSSQALGQPASSLGLRASGHSTQDMATALGQGLRGLLISRGLVEARLTDSSTDGPRKAAFCLEMVFLRVLHVCACTCVCVCTQACTVDRDSLRESPVTGMCIFLQCPQCREGRTTLYLPGSPKALLVAFKSTEWKEGTCELT